MSWKGVSINPNRRYEIFWTTQLVVSALILTVLVYITHNRELALTFYFLYAGPVVVTAYLWGKEASGLLILAVVSYFIPAMISPEADTGDLIIRAVELAASVALFGSLAVVGERSAVHRRQKERYRKLDKIGERFSRELKVEELLQVILKQTVPMFKAAGGEIVLRDERTDRLEVVAAVGVSQEARHYLHRHTYFETASALRGHLQSAQTRSRSAGHQDNGETLDATQGVSLLSTSDSLRSRGRQILADRILRENRPFLHNNLENDPRYVYCDGDTPLIKAQVHSVLAVPLCHGGEPFGLLSLFNKSDGGFNQSDIDFLSRLAEKSAIAIENARLYHRTDASLAQRVEELSMLNRIAQVLVGSLNLNQTIKSILDVLQDLLPFVIAEVCLWEPVNQIMRTYTWSGNDEYAAATGGFYRLNEGYSGWIASRQEPLWIPDVQAHQEVRPKVDSPDFPFRSYAGFPLRVEQQLIGTLELASYELDAFPTGTRSMLEALCNQAAIAIHNARLYQERQQRLAEMAGLQQISQTISSIRDVDQVYSVLTERIAQLMNVQYCGVLLYDEKNEALISRPPFYGVPSEMVEFYRISMPRDSLMWSIWEDAEYLYLNDVQTNPLTAQVGLTDLANAAGVRATMFAALAAGDSRFGIIQVSNKLDDSPFDESDARLLSIFANQAAVVLENARLYNDEQERRAAMEALQASVAAMSAPLDLKAVVQTIVEQAAAIFNADAISVMMPDPLEQYLLTQVSRGLSDDFVTGYRLPWDDVTAYIQEQGTHPRLFTASDPESAVPPDLIQLESLSWIAIAPLISGGETLGTLHFFGKANTRPFFATEIELLILFANQAAVSIQNARLYTQTDESLQRRLDELTVLSRIGQELNATLDMEHILNLVLKEAVRATNASHGNVNLIDWETETLKARAIYGLDPDKAAQRQVNLGLERGIIGRTAKTAQPIIVDDVTLDPDYISIVLETRSELAVPILHRGVVLGVVNLESSLVGGFTETHIGFLETLAAQAAVAINNARTYEDQQERSELLRRRAEQMSYLFEIGQTLRTDRSLDDVLTEVAFAVQETAGYNVAVISVRDRDKQQRIAAAGVPITEFERMKKVRQPWSNLEAIFKEEFRISNSYYVPFEQAEAVQHLDLLHLEQSELEREPGRWHSQDLLIVPLRGSSDVILGTLSVDQPQNAKSPDRAAVETLEIFAAQAALAIENARLVDALTRRVDELALFNEVARSISARLDLEGLLATVVEAAAELMDAPQSVLFLQGPSYGPTEFDQGADHQEIYVPWGARGYDLAKLESVRFHPGEGLVGAVIQEARATMVPDTLEDSRFQPLIPVEDSDRQVRSVILVPLIFGGRVVGVLNVEHFAPYAFSSVDIVSLSTLADQAAIAVENARLFGQTQRQLQERAIVNEIGHALSATVQLDELVDVLRRQMARLVPAESLYLALYDEATGLVSFPMFLRGGETVRMDPFSVDEGLTGHIVKTGKPLLLPANAMQMIEEMGLSWAGRPTRSYLGVPMKLGDKVVGVIAVQDFERDYVFDAGHGRALSTVAIQAAIAIENARLFEEVRTYQEELEHRVEERTKALEKERDRVETLYRITSELGTSLDLDRVLNRALSLILEAVRSEKCSVFIFDAQNGRLVNRAALWTESGSRAEGSPSPLPLGGVPTRFKRGEGLAGWVMTKKQPAIVNDIRQDPRWEEIEPRKRWHRSVLAVPLVVGDEAMGALLLYHAPAGYFSHEHLRLVEAVAAQVATAINNAELYGFVRESADRLGGMMKVQREDTAKTEAILEGVADGVMVADATSQVIRFNAAAERILNMPRKQVLGRSIDELLGLYGTSGAAWVQAMDEWTISPPDVGEGALFAERLEFEGRSVSVLLSPVVMRDEFLGTVSLFRDVTQQVELERTKSEFVATVSHELRTPMTSIKGYADLLLLGAAGQLNDNQERFLAIIKTNADRLTMLVNDLLDIGRIDGERIELNLKEVSLPAVVQVVIDSLKGRSADKKQTLEINTPDVLPFILADRDRLIQVLTNLISNAQQYTPTGGHISLTVSMPKDATSEAGQKMIQISVSDDGIGIARDEQDKIFDRFFRSDHPLVQETAGTGLGLPITQSLIEMHGGRLWLESEIGQGSTFSFTLPVATENWNQPAGKSLAVSVQDS